MKKLMQGIYGGDVIKVTLTNDKEVTTIIRDIYVKDGDKLGAIKTDAGLIDGMELKNILVGEVEWMTTAEKEELLVKDLAREETKEPEVEVVE